MRVLALSSLAALLASCASAPPPPPERIGTAAGPPLVAVTASATATATAAPSAPAPPVVSPYFPVVVHGADGFRIYPLKTGAAAVNGYAATLLHVDDRGARLEPSLTAGVKGLE